MSSRILAAAICLLTFHAVVSARTIRVPADHSTIQGAVDAATNGDVVLVSSGTYRGPANRGISFGGKNITVKSVSGARYTTIDAQDADRAFYFDGGESNAAVLEGFTIRDGNADLGGAIRCTEFSSPTIQNCIFRSNSADYGGAIAVYISDPVIRNCSFSYNYASVSGGAIDVYDSYPDIENCTIVYNDAAVSGGGLQFEDASRATVTNCILWGNDYDEIAVVGASVPVTYSDVQGGWPGTGNINVYPNFRYKAGFDYVLWSGSPCIDSATGSLDGLYWCSVNVNYCRFNSQLPDMGAYGGPHNTGWLP